MMNKDFAKKAIADDALWESIRHHREIYTSVKGVDYTPDIRANVFGLSPGKIFLKNGNQTIRK
jgi:hypothetical protein